jgi:hypothetical protein
VSEWILLNAKGFPVSRSGVALIDTLGRFCIEMAILRQKKRIFRAVEQNTGHVIRGPQQPNIPARRR